VLPFSIDGERKVQEEEHTSPLRLIKRKEKKTVEITPAMNPLLKICDERGRASEKRYLAQEYRCFWAAFP
jgi:hypothetical protein